MIDVMPRYFDASESFFARILDAKAEKEFLNAVSARADKIARDVCMTPDEHLTDILKGQLSICYELADGIRQAQKAREEKANSERAGRSPFGPDGEE